MGNKFDHLKQGLDIGLQNNRLGFILDYYNRTTKDLFTKQALPGLYRFLRKSLTNMGTLRNYGFEMEVRANILNNPKGLTLGCNMAKASLSSCSRDKIVK
ncbi:TonB-dependent receptor [Bacteroides fragilis]|nr:TonB-dependent receptor [Bacteroides fragilis]